MYINDELIKVSAHLGKYFVQNTTQTILDRMKAAKAKDDKEESISVLESIIEELIIDKREIMEIARVYDEHLVAQKISQEDIDYITNEIIPILEKLLEQNVNQNTEKHKKEIEMIKTLLSSETLNILQLLGFNFKQAIGNPLTVLVQNLILSQAPDNSEKAKELALLEQKKDLELYKVLQDENAFNRLITLQELR